MLPWSHARHPRDIFPSLEEKRCRVRAVAETLLPVVLPDELCEISGDEVWGRHCLNRVLLRDIDIQERRRLQQTLWTVDPLFASTH